MAILITLKGPESGRHYAMHPDATVLGRHPDAHICLESQSVSRHHARILFQEGEYLVEDLGSSNGTFLNGREVKGREPFTENDTLQVGPYLFGLLRTPPASASEESLIIRERIEADPGSQSLPGPDAAHKLRVVLEIAQHLGHTLDLETLLNKLLDQLMQLFPNADRAMVLLNEGGQLVVRAQRCRNDQDPTTYSYSRTIVQRALEEGVGLLSEDVRADERFQSSATLAHLDMRSILCVPLIPQDGGRLGLIHLDRFRLGKAFQMEDLQLLTAVCIQVAVVLENAALHAEILREEKFRQELALAREIQQSYLPREFPRPETAGFELFARLLPAREVAGDLYDFFPVGEGVWAFFIGDVSGKGMPAALFMIAVRTLARHLALGGKSPAETLGKLNTSLAADNASGMFVTLAHGLYQPATGELLLSSGGHPAPFLRRRDGQVEVVHFPSGRLLGYAEGNLHLTDAHLTLESGETLIYYTDGFTEAQDIEYQGMFGEERLQEALGGPRTHETLEACADYARAAVEAFTGTKELQDDMTLLLLRRGERG